MTRHPEVVIKLYLDST
jgi:lipid-A-disaccharide synthase-like uncharacterized protein